MKWLAFPLAVAAAGCAAQPVGPSAAVPQAAGWRGTASAHDRGRLRGWREAWVKGLAQARAAGNGPAIAAEGALLDPDAGLDSVRLEPGDYRCRTIKLGSPGGLLPYVAYPAFRCRIGAAEGGVFAFEKSTGSQRPVGRIFPDAARRMVFLGTLQLGDERGTLRYGHDRERDMIGLVERVGARRWRIAFPSPHFESLTDVIELVPAS
ncbi:MAG: DUF4893 domain-containing protein [Alphaproteobacteria bacterium]|nr:DUF4893 domain-containing protein [Alphaproteobacteria bacterium]MBV9371620.1 DUF4893 domain-containing protein [Alphaproteobacteria bacterium]MBV9901037.1 DUF4893 domain-containing protein [Alphaproteobacteria bacterium]